MQAALLRGRQLLPPRPCPWVTRPIWSSRPEPVFHKALYGHFPSLTSLPAAAAWPRSKPQFLLGFPQETMPLSFCLLSFQSPTPYGFDCMLQLSSQQVASTPRSTPVETHHGQLWALKQMWGPKPDICWVEAECFRPGWEADQPVLVCQGFHVLDWQLSILGSPSILGKWGRWSPSSQAFWAVCCSSLPAYLPK